jgi:excisionase family DNA binding protein
MNPTPQPDRTALLNLPDDAILTPAEVAVLLSVHVNTVLRLAAAGKLPCFPLPLGQKRKVWRAYKKDVLAIGAPSGHAGQLSTLPVPSRKEKHDGTQK